MLSLREAIERRQEEQRRELEAAEQLRRVEEHAKARRERGVCERFALHVERTEGIRTDASDWVACEHNAGTAYAIRLKRTTQGRVETTCSWGMDDQGGIYPQHTRESEARPWRASSGGTYAFCATLAEACIYAGIAE